MLKRLHLIVGAGCLAVACGCSDKPSGPASSTPEPTKEMQESMEKATKGGASGPEMLKKMQQQQQGGK